MHGKGRSNGRPNQFDVLGCDLRDIETLQQQVFDAFEGDDYVKTPVEVSVRREDG